MRSDYPSRTLARFCFPLLLGWAILASACKVQAADSEQERIARLKNMTPQQREELARKKHRFEELSPQEQERLRALHEAIISDPRAAELEETVRRYNQWLATLSSPKRAALTAIKDPAERIARIKEEMKEQEERRFRELVREIAGNLSSQDRDAIYKWFGDFVLKHQAQIRGNMPAEVRERFDRSSDPDWQRRELMRSWSIQHRQEAGTPVPNPTDFDELMANLSPETRRQIMQAAALAPQRQERLIELMRAAAFSRNAPYATREELLKFYESMKPDDPRRVRLEGREGDDFMSELRRVYFEARWRGRGFGGRGGPGEGRNGPPEAREGKGFRGPPAPGELAPPLPPPRDDRNGD